MKLVKSLGVALLLGTSLLAGCGAPGSQLAGNLATQAAPPAVALAKVTANSSARSYGQRQALINDATNCLTDYMNLRNQWVSTNDPNQQDQIAQQMLQTLTAGLKAVQNDGASTNDYRVQRGVQDATNALYQYNDLRNQWVSAQGNLDQQRQIVNQMLSDMTAGLKQVQYDETGN